MKIIIYGLNYAPEPTGIGKYTGDLARSLSVEGHEVIVITAPLYYPQWKVWNGYKQYLYRTELDGNLRVIRCPLWVPHTPTAIRRLVHLFSFAISSLPIVLVQTFRRPDVVWVCAPALVCTPAAILLGVLSGAKRWLHIQDFEVDVAFETGMLRSNLARYLVARVERWIYTKFDIVSTISKNMGALLRQKGVPDARIRHFPNWVDVDFIKPSTEKTPYRNALQIEDGAIVALFSGTLGAKQGLNIIVQAAKLLEHQKPGIIFVVCGAGMLEPDMRIASDSLTNFRYLPLQPANKLPTLLNFADIHLLTQDPDVSDLVMPSKLGAMLSSGRPVVTNVKQSSEVAALVQHCGVLATPGDAKSFADAVLFLAENFTLRDNYGAEARRLAEQYFGKEMIIRRFLEDCSKLAN